jgi:hypothetical protein
MYACHFLNVGQHCRCYSPGHSDSVAEVVAQALSTVERDVTKEVSRSFRKVPARNEGGQSPGQQTDDAPTSAADLEGVFGVFDEASRNFCYEPAHDQHSASREQVASGLDAV